MYMMKYYESTFEDYINAKNRYNIHKEIQEIKFPDEKTNIHNMIIYGPPGTGKYSEMLYMLKQYSPSNMKYEKKVIVSTEKQDFTFHMSDVHFEIDMGLLGCNAKMIFQEVFVQIMEILIMKTDKTGFLVCKNFHQVNNELLEVFYSYIQQVKITQNITLYFILITEHISYLPNNILDSFLTINIKRPDKVDYEHIIPTAIPVTSSNSFQKKMNSVDITKKRLNIDVGDITNIKELKVLSNKSEEDLSNDIFNEICDPLIDALKEPTINYINLRELIYDILTYNLDMSECIWYVYSFFIRHNYLSSDKIRRINSKLYDFIIYYNNNYRPIYHLESIFLYMIKEIHEL